MCIITSCTSSSNKSKLFLALLGLYLIVSIATPALAASSSSSSSSSCPNGCSSRGLCISGVCYCAEGLQGVDCSQVSPSLTTVPSPYDCPSCYQTIVGPAMYYYGPSWTLPDGPIVGMNVNGSLSVIQGNANALILASGLDMDDWEITPVTNLVSGPDFDVCGSWMMRTFTINNSVTGFYHAERACAYSNNGQTRKSAGYSISSDGLNFTKPNYPNNKIIDTNTTEAVGSPTGEGDFGVTIKDGYYYMVFSNVEDDTWGVARAPVSSGGVPGSWTKYYKKSWSQPGLGGLHDPMTSLTGTQLYLHTPSDTFLAVGNRDAYYQTGIAMSASDDGVNWNYVSDPLIGGDFATNKETILYQSLFGQTGGYDVGSKFELFYLWVPPGGTFDTRYQIRRSVSFQYVGPQDDSTPTTRLALTQYANRLTGERWESTQLAVYPYMPTKIVGYLMTRPTPNAFPVYECYNYATLDHYIGTADECFSANMDAYRVAGHMYAARVARSIAVYRCLAANDTFLSTNANCDGQALTQVVPFGYMLDGPVISPAVLNRDILIGQGTNWAYVSGATPSSQFSTVWTQLGYNDTNWQNGIAPFGTGYATDVQKTAFGRQNYFFRQRFTVAPGRTLQRLVASIASDDYGMIYINGVLIDSETKHHEASFWNRQVNVPLNLIDMNGPNIVAVVVMNGDQWAFFDFQLSARYVEFNASVPAPTTLVAKGSNWAYFNRTAPVGNWTLKGFDASSWLNAPAPFVTGYQYYKGTPFGRSNYYFRRQFTLPYGYNPTSLNLNVASDNYAIVYINGIVVDSDPATWHEANYWNRQITVNASVLVTGINTVAVVVMNGDDWAFFDLELTANYAVTIAQCPFDCGINGQCINGTCVCDAGYMLWGGCNTSLCTFSNTNTLTAISQGSSGWRHTQWSYVPSTPQNWFASTYTDSWWHSDVAPFGTSVSTGKSSTYMPAVRHLFRKTFSVNIGNSQDIQSGTVYISSAANHRIWLNGVFLGQPMYPADWHASKYWNQVITVPAHLISTVTNIIAIEITPSNAAFFDMKVTIAYGTKKCVVDTSTTTASVSTSTSTTVSATTSASSTTASSTTAATTSTSSTAAASTSSTSTARASTSAASTSIASTTASSASVASTSTSTVAASTNAASTNAASTASASVSATVGASNGITIGASISAAASTSAVAKDASVTTQAASIATTASTSGAKSVTTSQATTAATSGATTAATSGATTAATSGAATAATSGATATAGPTAAASTVASTAASSTGGSSTVTSTPSVSNPTTTTGSGKQGTTTSTSTKSSTTTTTKSTTVQPATTTSTSSSTSGEVPDHLERSSNSNKLTSSSSCTFVIISCSFFLALLL